MKKMTFFACAALLTSAVAFTSCNKNDQNEPGQKAPEVLTDIAISLPGQVGGPNRMPSSTVQKNGATDFSTNGMKDITLIPFAAKAKVSTTSTRNGDNIALGAIGAYQAYTDPANGGRAKVFTEKKVPTGTSAFLFYGESGKTGSTKFETGSLTGSFGGSTNPAAISFALEAINPSPATTIEDATSYKGLIAYLNHVANAVDDSTTANAWKNYTAALNEGYYELFNQYKTTKVLSSTGIQHMMTDLYKNLKPNKNDALAKSILDSIATVGEGNTWATVDGEGNVTLKDTYAHFPSEYNLPEGAVAVAYDADLKKFGGNAAFAFGELDPAQLDRYVYAPSLWYFSNTQIKTSTTPKESNYTGAASWKAILETYEKDNSSVNANTRSIALKDTIQYAVARLDVDVQLKNESYLEDNNIIAAANHITSPAEGYEITAVLVGGQKYVGFDFTPGTYASTSNAYTIYDKEMTSTMKARQGSFSAINSTLVLETAANEDQNIAIEVVNTSGVDFYGIDRGLVPAGAKFYLVGKLQASEATEPALEGKVFKQDYTTTVHLTIKDLKKAYSTIPDLKAPALEIGMSVDLSWRAGHTYEVDL